MRVTTEYIMNCTIPAYVFKLSVNSGVSILCGIELQISK